MNIKDKADADRIDDSLNNANRNNSDNSTSRFLINGILNTWVPTNVLGSKDQFRGRPKLHFGLQK